MSIPSIDQQFAQFVAFAEANRRRQENGEKIHNGPCRRLYVKCESHGAPHSAILDETVAKSRSKGMSIRSAQKGDWSESISHALSFLKTRGIDPASGGARRESMTAGVKASLKRLVEDLEASDI